MGRCAHQQARSPLRTVVCRQYVRTQYRESRSTIWVESLENNDAEIEKCGQRVCKLEAHNAVMTIAEERLHKKFENEALAWDGSEGNVEEIPGLLEHGQRRIG